MEPLDFTRCKVLNNIPSKKLSSYLEDIDQMSSMTDSQKVIYKIAINRWAESNIPIEYWPLKMEKDFFGDSRLKDKFDQYTSDLKSSFIKGESFCLAGSHGVGKSMVMACILKKASAKGYSCLYSTLSDMVSVLTQATNEDKFLAKQELTKVDFLVIDEFDHRFMANDSAADLYARVLEGVFRTRSQNKLPILMATNSPNVVESFNGALKASISSLMKGYVKVFSVIGQDVRGQK